ncbi:TSUP family transporter [Papillibacter cinnamivorans]|uniref:Probable membrane transporter protein n=1 Tax=Papillibacter cinnamivorans DSM 12816 TaxID=1122930 RepID=A0A1W1Z1J6_9FIRM|nr:TSUP family transporter [Papillibacter cinnamivorans]SMC42266.1 hypothetical protein SAMN02745168_0860 [Papillibacter cinnamivorans DSM 12816]
MKDAAALLAGFLTGILSGFGIGGGTLLLLYMTLLAGVEQQLAQGINLLYFLPASAASLLSHGKNGYLDREAALPAAIAGAVCTALAAWAAVSIDVSLLRRLFGVFLICVGLCELFRKNGKKDGNV